ncbi:hypothetical protein M885DRAFT_276769 [Pelagophyceae sp. CCMP2097]|nr:hypothetical protein M885DRAFT_276769 [Pelagophyceae sp. CCMP2097]
MVATVGERSPPSENRPSNSTLSKTGVSRTAEHTRIKDRGTPGVVGEGPFQKCTSRRPLVPLNNGRLQRTVDKALVHLASHRPADAPRKCRRTEAQERAVETRLSKPRDRRRGPFRGKAPTSKGPCVGGPLRRREHGGLEGPPSSRVFGRGRLADRKGAHLAPKKRPGGPFGGPVFRFRSNPVKPGHKRSPQQPCRLHRGPTLGQSQRARSKAQDRRPPWAKNADRGPKTPHRIQRTLAQVEKLLPRVVKLGFDDLVRVQRLVKGQVERRDGARSLRRFDLGSVILKPIFFQNHIFKNVFSKTCFQKTLFKPMFSKPWFKPMFSRKCSRGPITLTSLAASLARVGSMLAASWAASWSGGAVSAAASR